MGTDEAFDECFQRSSISPMRVFAQPQEKIKNHLCNVVLMVCGLMKCLMLCNKAWFQIFSLFCHYIYRVDILDTHI